MVKAIDTTFLIQLEVRGAMGMKKRTASCGEASLTAGISLAWCRRSSRSSSTFARIRAGSSGHLP